MSFLRKLFGGDEPLSGAPPVRRPKTHSAESGYVYEYVFEGFRHTGQGDPGYVYVFSASGNRRDWARIAVLLEVQVLASWSAHHQDREFSASERFGIAKIALRRAFDAAESPAALGRTIRLTPDELSAIIQILDLY